ncbi:MAG: glycosyl hydrolase [Verrucomicrobiota bacterium]
MKPNPFEPKPSRLSVVLAALLLAGGAPALLARPWSFTGIPQPVEAEFVGMKNGGVVLQGPNGKSFEVPFANFTPADQQYLRALEAGGGKAPPAENSGKPITTRAGYTTKSVETCLNQVVPLKSGMEFHVTGTGDPIAGSTFDFTASDGWLFLENVDPSFVKSKCLTRMRINGERASLTTNIRVVQYGSGTVVIPHAPDFEAMTVYDGKSLEGESIPLKCYVEYGDAKLGKLKNSISSFILRRGYTATIAQQENGTGVSRNYVAQDHDLEIKLLPKGLDDGVRFVRIFPWRWTGKKGIAGGIWQNLNVDWFYDWNISTNSSLDLEYVPIRQKRGWPGLDQNWKERGSTHLLGFNEPDRPDQAKLTVAEALQSWPDLLATGLRLGAPAVSDGGLGWLYEFMDKADAAGLRVDFVAVHYYRAVANPDDAKGAADQLYRYLKGIHDRTKRPIWLTEWNNGANWTTAPDPNEKQQKAAIAAMIKMMDDTPFVERYALYNWVEDARQLQRKDGSLTPAGEVYRDKVSPISYVQESAK